MSFGTLYGSGVNFSQIDTAPEDNTGYAQDVELGSGFAPGTIMFGSDGSAFIYVSFGTGGSTGNGYVCTYDDTYEAVMVTSSNDALGAPVGVAQAAATSGQYGWLQVLGYTNIFGVASALANGRLATTATAGVVDDAGSVGTLYVQGMIFTTAVDSGGNALTAGFVSWPVYQQVGTYA